MDPPSYILDPRFEEIGCAFKMNGEKTIFVDAPDIPKYLKWLGDPSRVMFINHNTLFDASIASWRHGWVAGMYVDTLSLARALLGHILPRLGLEYVAMYYGLPPKGKAIMKVADLTRAQIIASGLYQEYADYSCLDADLCWEIFLRLCPAMPATELVIADMVQRMAIVPKLKLNPELLAQHLGAVQAEKQSLLFDAGFTKTNPDGTVNVDDLMSNDKFALALEGRGVDPPKKISATTGEETFAFAKTDEDFKALLDHHDPAVQTLVAARMGIKSTIEETRTKRFINISTLNFPAYGTNLFPIALKVAGAHTHRLSGDWKLNQQNMSRPSRKRPRAMLRESIVTPEGYLLVVGDESQIEARMNACFAGQWDLVGQFERGEDPYSIQATKIYGYPVSKNTPPERFVGKTLVLSAGYGVGWVKYQASIKHLSKEQTGTAIELSDYDAERHINLFRQTNDKIRAHWYYANNVVIPAMATPGTDFMWGPLRVMHEKIVGPNGLCLNYKGLHRNPNSGDWLFVYGNRIKKIYGGKLIENVIQFLARVVIMEAALRLKKPARDLGCTMVLQCHDELGYIAPEGNEFLMRDLLTLELRRRPTWMPKLPLNCETGIGKNYGEAK